MKLWKSLVAVGLAGVVLAGCGSEVAEDKPETEVAPVERVEVAPTPTPTPDPVDEWTVEKPDRSQEQLEKDILAIFQNNFDRVEFDREHRTYKVYPEGGLAEEVAKITMGLLPKDDWDELVDSLLGTSEGIQDVLGSGYSIALMNPENENNILLLVADGFKFYDVVNEDGLAQ